MQDNDKRNCTIDGCENEGRIYVETGHATGIYDLMCLYHGRENTHQPCQQCKEEKEQIENENNLF